MFDLDPSEGSGFDEVIEVARLVKQTLDLLELASYPKTSGSRGIHVLVPIARRHSFEEVREFAGSWPERSLELIRASRRPNGRGEAPRRSGRREPERAWQTNAERLLGPAAGRRAGLDAAALGGGRPGTRPGRVHDGGGPRSRRAVRRPRGRRARRQAVAEGLRLKIAQLDRYLSSPRLCGCPSIESSTMSRRKKRATVQSATTRSFRVKSGSW